MDISKSNFAMAQDLMVVMNNAVNTLAKRGDVMGKCCQELNMLRVFASENGFEFAIGDLVSHKNLSVYLAANMEACRDIESELLMTFRNAANWYVEPVVNDHMGMIDDALPAMFDEYILQKSFLATSPVGQGQQSQIRIFYFAK